MDRRRWGPAVLLVVLVAALFITGLLMAHWVAAALAGAAAWLRGLGPAGEPAFVAAVGLVALAGIVPGSVLGLAAGALYGVGAGFLTAAAGIFIGALLAFALSRSMLRPVIATALGRRARLAAFDTLVTKDSWRLVALLRVSPVMPFSLTSYALGLSGIALRDYLVGTLAAAPALLGYVVIGALGRSSLAGGAAIHLAILVIGAAATLALTVHLTRLLTKALRAGTPARL